MTVILHMSDPHFGTEQAPVAEALANLARSQSPDLLILSGDITQRAQPGEFEAAKAFIDRLGLPASLVIPGNHDIPLYHVAARLAMPYARYRAVFGDDLEPVHDTEQLLAIGVNTTRRYRHIDGEVSTVQIERVAERLERATAAQLRIVVTHQPVHVIHAEDEENLLHGRAQAIKRWAEAGVDLILGGHIHRPYVCGLHDLQPRLPYPVWVVQAGTALSSRTRHDAGNSVNVIRYHGLAPNRCCMVERWDYVDALRSFMLMTTEELVCDARTLPLPQTSR